LFVKISVVLACLSFSLGWSAPWERIRQFKINVAVGKKEVIYEKQKYTHKNEKRTCRKANE
jgi:hypothetical protein